MRTSDSNRLKRTWAWTVLPVNAGMAGFLTWVPLYVLQLGGTVVEVALLTGLYYFVLIPSSVFWGMMTDRLSRRRFFFLVSFSGVSVIFVAMYMLQNLSALTVLYAALGIVVVANSAAVGLLVMETSEKSKWMTSFSWLSLLSAVGSVTGTIAGLLWVSFLPLVAFLIFCAASTGLSLVLAFLLVPEPAIPLETVHLVLLPLYLSRIYHRVTFGVQHLFIKPFSSIDVVKRIRALRGGAMDGRAQLLLSAFVFVAGGSLLSTPFTPFLASRGVLANEIFAVSSVNILLQIGAYRWISQFIEWFGGTRAALNIILLRPVLQMTLAVSAVLFTGTSLFVIAAVFFGLSGGTYAIWNSATSVTLYSSLGGTRQGNILGWYTAMSSLGVVVGSFLSGYFAFYFGYSMTFTIGAILTLATFFIQRASLRNLGYIKPESH